MKIFCFGELLLRISPAANGEWIKQASLPVFVGGAELNVATALASWNQEVGYMTALPDNTLTTDIKNHIQSKKIDTSPIHISGNRIGTYYLTQGADLKSVGVIYDRAYSSFSELKPGIINWEEVLKGYQWFHFSAISPALNQQVADLCEEALIAASKLGLKISVDLNYRSRLWKYGKAPVEIMPKLAAYCDLIMGNIWSAAELLGTSIDADIHQNASKEKYLAHATKTSVEIMSKFANCELVANTFRFDDAEGLKYYASLNNKNEQWVSKQFFTISVVDKIGSGDCFMGGLIYSLVNKQSHQDTINFAAAAAFGKLQEKGDATAQKVAAVLENLKHGE